jgi:hypothetical protein
MDIEPVLKNPADQGNGSFPKAALKLVDLKDLGG